MAYPKARWASATPAGLPMAAPAISTPIPTRTVAARAGRWRQREGAHALVAFSRREPGKLVAARVGNAGGVVVGYGRDEMFLASDLPALLPHTQSVAFLADGEIAAVTPCGASYLTAAGEEEAKQAQNVSYDPLSAARGNYKNFMLNEVCEQPELVRGTT